MSPELQEFYNSYQTWLERGAPDCAPYDRRFGLCVGIHTFIRLSYADSECRLLWTTKEIMRKLMCEEIQLQFMGELEKGDNYPELIGIYPFGSSLKYYAEEARRSAHLNTKRKAWVRNHATNVKDASQ